MAGLCSAEDGLIGLATLERGREKTYSLLRACANHSLINGVWREGGERDAKEHLCSHINIGTVPPYVGLCVQTFSLNGRRACFLRLSLSCLTARHFPLFSVCVWPVFPLHPSPPPRSLYNPLFLFHLITLSGFNWQMASLPPPPPSTQQQQQTHSNPPRAERPAREREQRPPQQERTC